MKHTKGKWEIIPDEECSNKYQAGKLTRRFDIRNDNFLIATVWAEDEFRNKKTPVQMEQEANARLIAAAPDLLVALRNLTLYTTDLLYRLDNHVNLGDVEEIQQAKQTIEQAERS